MVDQRKCRGTVEIELPPARLKDFYPLFQTGAELEVEVGHSITELLVDQFGIDPDYISGRITTLFLNHKAVDDAKTALVADGSVLALSGAMPGLVGATMRTGGFYSAMRSGISFENEGRPAEKLGRIKIKLFNLLLDELGPVLLKKGVVLEAAQLRELLGPQLKDQALAGLGGTQDGDVLTLRVAFRE